MIRKDIVQSPKMPCICWKMLMGLYKGYFSLLSSLEMWQNNHDALCLCLFNDCFYLQVFEASASFQVILCESLECFFCGNFLRNVNMPVILEVWRRAVVLEHSGSLARVCCACLDVPVYFAGQELHPQVQQAPVLCVSSSGALPVGLCQAAGAAQCVAQPFCSLQSRGTFATLQQ